MIMPVNYRKDHWSSSSSLSSSLLLLLELLLDEGEGNWVVGKAGREEGVPMVDITSS